MLGEVTLGALMPGAVMLGVVTLGALMSGAAIFGRVTRRGMRATVEPVVDSV